MKRLLGALVLIALIAFGVYEARFWYDHVHEANARLQARFTVLASAVNGKVAALHAETGQSVERGQLLATMDDEQARLEVDSLAAEIERLRSARAEIDAELKFFLGELADRIATARAETRVLDDTLSASRERLALAQKRVERNSELASRSVVTGQGLDDANDQLLAMTERLRELEAKRILGERRVSELGGQRKRELVFRARLAKIDREIEKTAVALRIAERRLEDMLLVSPVSGVLNRIYVNPGTYVEDGEPLLLLHDPADLWVEAHVAESDIRLVRVGQAVQVELDAYPFETFRGEVRAIGRVTVGQTDAATAGTLGNGGVERVQVDVSLNDVNRPLWPGMRAAVNIVVRP